MMVHPLNEELLTSGDVARRLGVSGQQVHKLAKAGKLPVAGTTRSGTRLYRATDIERIAEEREKSPPRRGRPPGRRPDPTRTKKEKVSNQ